jgi:signal recognition particle subunit SEC65
LFNTFTSGVARDDPSALVVLYKMFTKKIHFSKEKKKMETRVPGNLAINIVMMMILLETLNNVQYVADEEEEDETPKREREREREVSVTNDNQTDKRRKIFEV